MNAGISVAPTACTVGGRRNATSPLTILLCRLIGLFMLLLAVAEAMQPAKMVEAANQIASSSALLLLAGMLTLLAGLAIVLAHNIWRGGLATVVVTVLGWLLLIKGICLLIVPPDGWTAMLLASRYGDFYLLYLGGAVLLGLFLTYAGFFGGPGRKT